MPSVRLASAVRLALDAPTSGVIAPQDDSFDVAWLDLTQQHPKLAADAIQFAVGTLSPWLCFQGSARLVVSTGLLDPKDAARVLATGCDRDLQTELAIGVVRGESLIDRLEELALAGCDLRESPDGGRLLDEPKAPATVLAPTGAGPVAETMAAGARIVLTQAADVGTMAVATAAEAFAWPSENVERYATAAAAARLAASCDTSWIDLSDDGSIGFASTPSTIADEIVLPDLSCRASRDSDAGIRVSSVKPAAFMRRVNATIPTGWHYQTTLRIETEAVGDRLVAQIAQIARAVGGARAIVERASIADGGVVVVRCDADDLDELAIASCFAKRLLLFVTTLEGVAPVMRSMAQPIAGPIQSYREWTTEAPTELLQYGVDVRPAGEWLVD